MTTMTQSNHMSYVGCHRAGLVWFFGMGPTGSIARATVANCALGLRYTPGLKRDLFYFSLVAHTTVVESRLLGWGSMLTGCVLFEGLMVGHCHFYYEHLLPPIRLVCYSLRLQAQVQ